MSRVIILILVQRGSVTKSKPLVVKIVTTMNTDQLLPRQKPPRKHSLNLLDALLYLELEPPPLHEEVDLALRIILASRVLDRIGKLEVRRGVAKTLLNSNQ